MSATTDMPPPPPPVRAQDTNTRPDQSTQGVQTGASDTNGEVQNLIEGTGLHYVAPENLDPELVASMQGTAMAQLQSKLIEFMETMIQLQEKFTKNIVELQDILTKVLNDRYRLQEALRTVERRRARALRNNQRLAMSLAAAQKKIADSPMRTVGYHV